MPLLISLSELGPIVPATRTTPLRVKELVALSAPGASPSLLDGLERAVESGCAALLLDGLDEVLGGPDRVVDALRQVLDSISADVDVVVSSRHSAVRAATRLDLLHVDLETPSDLEGTTTLLLRHLAPQLGDSERKTWLRQREEYIRRSRDAEPALWSVPLLSTLAVLLLTELTPEQMPTTRAQLLLAVIHDSVRRWTAHRADAVLPGLDRPMSVQVLIDTFSDVAAAVAEGGAWELAHTHVSERLRGHWGRPPGEAAAIADAILNHWDATAGVFVTASPRGPLRARTRLMTEIGDAMQQTRDGADPSAWMERALHEPERHETVRLAAGLTRIAAASLVDVATRLGGDPLDVACSAWADGADLPPESQRRLIAAQLARTATLSQEVPERGKGWDAFRMDNVSPRLRLAVQLATLPLTAEEIHQLTALCGEMSQSQQMTIRALAVSGAAEGPSGAAEVLDELEAAVNSVAADYPEEGAESSASYPPHGLQTLIERALSLLLPARPETARAIAKASYRSSFSTFQRASTQLRLSGQAEALKGISKLKIPATLPWDSDDADQPFLLVRTHASGTPHRLSASQAWHLDEVGALTDGLQVGQQTIGTAAHATNHHAETTMALVRAYAEAAGIPFEVVVAQLNQLESESPGELDLGLIFSASRRLPVAPLRVEDRHLDAAQAGLQTGNPWLITVAAHLYLDAEAVSRERIDQLRTILPALTPAARLDTALCIRVHDAGADLDLTDAPTRAGAATASAIVHMRNDDPLGLVHALADPDLLVREMVARVVTDVPLATSALLRRALDQEAQQWTCIWCGRVNPATATSCPEPRSHPRPTPRIPEVDPTP